MLSLSPVKPHNNDSLGVIGYLIVVNRQVHNFQIDILSEYLDSLGLDIKDTPIDEIISGRETSLSFASSLSAFTKEPKEVQRSIYYVLILLSAVDNVIDGSESELIEQILSSSSIEEYETEDIVKDAMNDAAEMRQSENRLFERPYLRSQPQKENIFKRIWNWIVRLFARIFHIEKEPESQDAQDESKDYLNAVERCAEIAKEDFSIVKPSYTRVIEIGQQCIDQMNAYKRSLLLETGLSAEVAAVVKTFVDALNENVLRQAKSAEISMNQKERSLTDFTISFIGRTKAGKSTLHSILTNRGKDSIGSGKQRTTRYNRVFQWNLLRLIDTPGIGSPEAEGRTDDEIAQSVLGESDVICFVIVDDSILKDVLDFIEKIAALNKPIIILLNHKENIRSDVKYRRFLEKPLDWLETSGESNLDGHINRIQKYADDHGFGHLVRVFPVFLLAAQMAGEEEYSDHSELLWNSSNMEAFIDQLKTWIVDSGTIKRSQTIIDEAVQFFSASSNKITDSEKPLLDQIERLSVQQVSKIDALVSTKKETLNKIRDILQNEFNDLAQNKAVYFAEDVYGVKGDTSDQWNTFVQKIKFEETVNDEVAAELNAYYEKADDTIRELFEDLYYSAKMSCQINNIAIPLQWDFKSIFRLGGGAVGLAGTIVTMILGVSNPVGWILTGIGVVVGLGSMLFDSKDKKRQKAINKIYETVRDNILNQAPEHIEETVSTIDEEISKSISRISGLFSDLVAGLNTTIGIAGKMRGEYDEQIERLNRVYAWRLIQFLRDERDPYSEEVVNSDIADVERTEDGRIIIRYKCAMSSNKSLDGIIGDRIIIEEEGT